MWGGRQLFAFVGGGAAGASIALQTNADKHTFIIPFKCKPIRAGVTVTTVLDGAAIVAFDRQPAAGSATDRGDGDCGYITIPTTTAAGAVVYDKTNYYSGVTAGAGVWIESLNEGDAVVFQLISASTSGGGVPWLIVEVDSEQPGNNSAMTLTA